MHLAMMETPETEVLKHPSRRRFIIEAVTLQHIFQYTDIVCSPLRGPTLI